MNDTTRYSGKGIHLLPLFFAAMMILSGCAEREKSGQGRGESAVTGEDVKKELGEAVRTTKDYLGQKTADMHKSIDERLQSMEEGISQLQERAAEAGEQGRQRADETMEALRAKQEAARERLKEFREAGGEFKEKAKLKLDEAMKDLDEAYHSAREGLSKDDSPSQ